MLFKVIIDCTLRLRILHKSVRSHRPLHKIFAEVCTGTRNCKAHSGYRRIRCIRIVKSFEILRSQFSHRGSSHCLILQISQKCIWRALSFSSKAKSFVNINSRAATWISWTATGISHWCKFVIVSIQISFNAKWLIIKLLECLRSETSRSI